jgi:hypothetical protein
MHPLEKIRRQGVGPINRQTAGVMKDSFAETFGLVRLTKQQQAEEARRARIRKIKRGTFTFQKLKFKLSWNIDTFARVNGLDPEDRKTQSKFARIEWYAEADMRDIAEAINRGAEPDPEKLRCRVRT